MEPHSIDARCDRHSCAGHSLFIPHLVVVEQDPPQRRIVIFCIGITTLSSAAFFPNNLQIAQQPIALWLIQGLDPIGVFIGLNGVILLAYIVAIPANEIVIPTVLMLTTMVLGQTAVGEGAGVLMEASTSQVGVLLHAGGWTLLTAVNLMLFSLLHNPCSTTIYTIYKETQSKKWTLIATLLPVLYGIVVCFLVARIFG